MAKPDNGAPKLSSRSVESESEEENEKGATENGHSNGGTPQLAYSLTLQPRTATAADRVDAAGSGSDGEAEIVDALVKKQVSEFCIRHHGIERRWFL